jgi:hypothetical protein
MTYNIMDFLLFPLLLGNSGQRSRTSKINNFLLNQRFANIPGMPIVKGVDVAKTISKGSRKIIPIESRVNLIKTFVLSK